MEECACVYVDMDEGEPGECVEQKTVVARKICHCSECGRQIKPGETYERVRGKWDCDWYSFKTCSTCLAIRESLFCEGYSYGGLKSDLQYYIEHIGGQISEDCLASMTKEARSVVCEMINDYWESMY